MSKLGISGGVAAYFQHSPLTPLLIMVAILMGVYALIVTPQEEEPQLDLSMATVMVPFPGASAKDVENMVTTPLEQVLSLIPNVDHITSISRPGLAYVTVLFEVGIKQNDAVIRVNDAVQSHLDRVPADFGVSAPLIKSLTVYDVPVMTITLFAKNSRMGVADIERIAQTLESEIKQIAGTREVNTIGGPGHRVSIQLDVGRLGTAGITVSDIKLAVHRSNIASKTGATTSANQLLLVEVDSLLRTSQDVANVVVGHHDGRPIFLSDVAKVTDEPTQPDSYVWHGLRTDANGAPVSFPAVSLTITKKPGEDAARIASDVRRKLDSLQNVLIPPDVDIAITRDYGEKGADKARRLMLKLVFATIAVTILVLFAVGWREAFLVGTAVILTLALTFFTSWLMGYTLNRVSLFALIFAVGILVDDAIVVVENIHRHKLLTPNLDLRAIIPGAVEEVGGPTILATVAVVIALLPLLYVKGQLGPYLSPIAILSSVGMVISLMIAFTLTPWMALRYLGKSHQHPPNRGRFLRQVNRFRTLFIEGRNAHRNRVRLFVAMPVLIVVACGFLIGKIVIGRTMPYENISDFQIIIDMPPNTPVEKTAALVRQIGSYIVTVPELKNYQAYVGVPAPIDFNGLARQYHLRTGGQLATIQVNLVDKHHRKVSGHVIAARVRPELHKLADSFGAVLRVAEPPPGPPSFASITAEIYGPDDNERLRIAREVKSILKSYPDVSDVVDSTEAAGFKTLLAVDQRRSGALGIPPDDIANTLKAGLEGEDIGYLHDGAKYPTAIQVRLPIEDRVTLSTPLQLKVRESGGVLVPLAELVSAEKSTLEQPILHKDLRPVIFVGGDMSGGVDSPLYAMFSLREKMLDIAVPGGTLKDQLVGFAEDTQKNFTLKWDGEWRMTYETFRDLGIGYSMALILIYLLLVGHFRSYTIPLILMAPIPLTLIGLIPGHAVTNAQMSASTAVGIMALAGIMVRNSILLIDFIDIARSNGHSLAEAVIAAPLARAKPIFLTAGTAMLSGYFILGDQFFDGLGTTLIFGVLVSTILTLAIIPLLYYHFRNQSYQNPT